MSKEFWKPVLGYEDRYVISNKGRIYSKKLKRCLKPLENEKGYLTIELWRDYKRKVVKIHRLVAETFLENLQHKKEVNHKDGNKQNNCIENLEWCTRSENMIHAYKIGLRRPSKEKEYGSNSKSPPPEPHSIGEIGQGGGNQESVGSIL